MGRKQTRLISTEFDDLLISGKVIKEMPSKRLRCFMCGRYKQEKQGEWLKAPTAVSIFTCNNCIKKHGRDQILLGYEKM